MKADNTELEKAVQWFDSRPLMEKMLFADQMNKKYAELPDNDKLYIYLNQERFYEMCKLDNPQYNAYRKSETSQAATPDLSGWSNYCPDCKATVKVNMQGDIIDGHVCKTPESVEQAALIFNEFEKFAELSEFMFEMARSGKSPWKWSRFCEVINDLCKKQSEQFPSACKESQGDVAEFKSIVEYLAAWSKKYPRGTVYSFNAKIDEQLIAIEERAKELIQRLNPKQ